MEHRHVKVGLVQMACGDNTQENYRIAEERIRECAGKGASVICLQELFSSVYFCRTEDYDNFRLAEPVPGPTTRKLQELAATLNVVIIGSLFEKRTKGVYHNTVAVIDAGGEYLGKYRKNHIPDDPGFYEKFYFTPGDTGYAVFNTKYGKIGTLICWDQWYPEAARITSLMGAEILVYPTAIGWATSQSEAVNRQQFSAWQTIQRAHAVANGVFVMAVNRTGMEGEIHFWGGSFIADPFGSLVCECSHDREECPVTDLDLHQIDEARVHWPFLRDRRIDTYGPLLERFLDK